MNVEDKAIEALKQQNAQIEQQHMKMLDSAFLKLKQKFPDLIFDRGNRTFLLGKYKFGVTITGHYTDTYEPDYILVCKKTGRWICNMASFGELILEDRKNTKPKLPANQSIKENTPPESFWNFFNIK